jgi:GntR family transcriptional regulator, rspAB operon transcriptional repressor
MSVAKADSSGRPANLVDANLSALSELRASNLVDLVFEEVRAAILDKSLPPGLRVTEAGLARHLNVSKTPVREALLRLRQIGLIEDDARRGGSRVVSPSREVIEEAFEIRQALEAFTARIAAERATKAQRVALVAAAEESLGAANVGDTAGFSQWDAVFHEHVAASTSNARLIRQLTDACALITTLRSRDLPHARASIECATDHVAIAAAIDGQNASGAADAMSAHLQRVKDYVLEALADALDSPASTA